MFGVSDTQWLRSEVRGTLEAAYFWQVRVDFHVSLQNGHKGFCVLRKYKSDRLTCNKCYDHTDYEKDRTPRVCSSLVRFFDDTGFDENV